jgi:hypothetical protein
MQEWGYWESDACPCCGKADERTTHFPFCDNEEMSAAYEKAITDFSKWMDEADTDPCIATYFTAALQERGFPQDYPLPSDMEGAEQDQRNMGWNNVLFGRLATKWMHLQELHLSSKRSRRSSERWAADMTYKLLEMSHTLWMTRNGILHERDRQGMLLAEGQTLHDAITECYARGRRALLPVDHHLLERSLKDILAMTAMEKYTWLGAIQLAHTLHKDEERSPASQMRQSLSRWLQTGQCRPTSTEDNNNDEEDDETPPVAAN